MSFITYASGSLALNARESTTMVTDPTGQILLLGNPNYEDGQGYVQIYKKKSGKYKLYQTLNTIEGNRNTLFGYALAISSDGNTIAVGAPMDHGVGTVHIYKRDNEKWNFITKVMEVDQCYDSRFGDMLSIINDTTLIAGGSGKKDNSFVTVNIESGKIISTEDS